MKVTNNTSFPIIAFGVFSEVGYGNDVAISPGQVAEVNGPYLGEMDGGDCHILLQGEIVCQETPDDETGFQVIQGNPLFLGEKGGKGITVRHHLDEPEEHVISWRNENSD